jgi:hypothetical protein
LDPPQKGHVMLHLLALQVPRKNVMCMENGILFPTMDLGRSCQMFVAIDPNICPLMPKRPKKAKMGIEPYLPRYLGNQANLG